MQIQTKVWNYNKMNVDGNGDEDGVDGDDINQTAYVYQQVLYFFKCRDRKDTHNA